MELVLGNGVEVGVAVEKPPDGPEPVDFEAVVLDQAGLVFEGFGVRIKRILPVL